MSHLDEEWQASDHIPGTCINVMSDGGNGNGYLVALINPSYCGEEKAIANGRKIEQVNNLIRSLEGLANLIDLVDLVGDLKGSAIMADAREVLARAKGGQ